MKYKFAALISLMLISGASFAQDTAKCVTANNHQIEKLFDKWNDSLKTGDPKIVTDNYLSDAVLLPTLSNKVRLSEAERLDYFQHFLEKHPIGKIDSRTIKIHCDSAIDTGTYTFTFADKTSVSARYTFTYFWNGIEWKISTHHSSAMPEK